MEALPEGLDIKGMREYIMEHGLCGSIEDTEPGGMLSACFIYPCDVRESCQGKYGTGCPMVGAIKG